MERSFKKLTAFSLLFFFTLGVWCASLAAPNLSVASATQRCPQNNLALGKIDCDQPNFMCSLGLDPRSSSTVAITSPRANEFPKAQSLPVEGAVITGLTREISLATAYSFAVNLLFPEKVPIHLFNSVLNL